MSLNTISAGSNLPEQVNVIIEIPLNGHPVKYEVDKDSGALFVDRFMATAMFYPCNYGYIPQTLSDDGDPADVLVVAPFPLVSGSVIACRVVGMLKMTDESGEDAKLIAVPTSKLSKLYDDVQSYEDLPRNLTASIEHFFQHYKDLEENKWVKIDGWRGKEEAMVEIMDSVKRYQETL